jgi:hypothetical protein
MFHLQDIDYRQLRNLFTFVREQAGRNIPAKGWARYTLTDIAGIEVALRLTRGFDSARPSSQFRLKHLALACAALRAQGFTNPLLQVPMRRDGDRIFALVGSSVVEPATGQLVMQRASEVVSEYLKSSMFPDQELEVLLEAERIAVPSEPSTMRSDHPLLVVRPAPRPRVTG